MSEGLLVRINREPGIPGSDYFTLTTPDGKQEELLPDETREWFRLRGADMDKLETALDECWNFWESWFLITKPRVVKSADKLDPKV